MIYSHRIEKPTGNELVLATVKRRLAAFIIDCLVVLLIYFIIIFLFSFLSLNDWNVNVKGIFDVDIETNIQNKYLSFFLKALFGLLPVIYFTLIMYFTKGRTVGKLFLRLKVVSLYHERVGLWHCFERSLGYFTSALESGFGFIQAIWNPNRMALHDKLGETIVIKLPDRKHK
jgi:uncharacterized RDD family membrane protein YckC